MEAYQAALEGKPTAAGKAVGAERSAPGSISALIALYYTTPAFRTLAASTQVTYRGILERFRKAHGDKRIATLKREHVRHIIRSMQETPSAANNLLDRIRGLMQLAIEEGLREDDPSLGVKKISTKTDGFYTWSETDIAQFEAQFPIGTRARLAFSLLLYTAQRRSDVVRMGPQHISDGVLTIRQQKTGMEVGIPIHPELHRVLNATPTQHLAFLVTAQGKPFTPPGFTNWFRECVHKAGLSDGCSPHGLRKAAARRLAEAGCTAHEIMAVTGHQSLEEVERYTRAAGRRGLAARAMGRLETKS
ncbi:tyrosine-type recombinase/integrase [Methylobacterium sp. EM32]|uniref:tyrosine-type recombinase/integrase n=1 Tax=Methylobacterium sp. EM32 TaxID=3163481 RepID=UPI0033B2AD92